MYSVFFDNRMNRESDKIEVSLLAETDELVLYTKPNRVETTFIEPLLQRITIFSQKG